MPGRLLFFLSVFFLLAVSCTSLPFSASEPTLVFRLIPGKGLPFSQGFRGRSPALLLWDTGASYSVAPDRGEASPSPSVFQQGPSRIPYHPLSLNSRLFLDGGFSGLLGADVLENHLVIFNFRDSTVTLTSLPLHWFKSAGARPFSFTLAGGRPLIRVTVDEHDYTALLDTGSADFLTLQGTAVRHLSANKVLSTLSRVESENAFETFTTRRVVLLSARVFGQKLTHPVVSLEIAQPHSTDDEAHRITAGDPYQAVVGYGFLKRGILTLDYRHGIGFWFTQEP